MTTNTATALVSETPTLGLEVEIKPREDGKPGWIGLVRVNGATFLAMGPTGDAVAEQLVIRVGDYLRGGK